MTKRASEGEATMALCSASGTALGTLPAEEEAPNASARSGWRCTVRMLRRSRAMVLLLVLLLLPLCV